MEMKIAIQILAAGILGAWTVAAQEPAMPNMQMPEKSSQSHHEMKMEGVRVELPRFGRAQAAAPGELFSLEQAQSVARTKNPTLRQAVAEIQAAKARAQQAGLYPNPVVGYSGDEIRGGTSGGGKQGFFVEQRIVMGGKLAKARDVATKDASLAEIEAEEQKIRVETAVRIAFCRVLAAQELADARRDLAKIAAENVEVQKRLQNTGQADESEILEAEVDASRMKLMALRQENTLREEWRSLAAVMGDPELPIRVVSGELETGWPQLSDAETVEAIAKQSPALRIATTAGDRAQSDLLRTQREVIPDLLVRGGMEYNNELLGVPARATGWQGTAQVGVEIPIFNRNQGNVAAAKANLQRSADETRRIELTLRERAAGVMDLYANARLSAEQYRDEMLPKTKKAYQLLNERYGEMLVSYPRVLESKRKLFELHCEYIVALESVWTNGIALQGYLLTDGLEAPTRPGDVDRPIRETNVPAPERTSTVPE